MSEEERVNHIPLIIALVIIGLTFFFTIAVYFHVFKLHTYFEQFYYHHWFTWIGTFYIAIATPVFYLLKRRYPNHYKAFLHFHVYGNLVAVMLISIHFIQEVSRPPQSYPNLGTGVVLYVVMITLVVTGFLLRFVKPKKFLGRSTRFIHTAVTVSFYLIIVVHILHGLNVI